jgi:hypothetical protein
MTGFWVFSIGIAELSKPLIDRPAHVLRHRAPEQAGGFLQSLDFALRQIDVRAFHFGHASIIHHQMYETTSLKVAVQNK